LSSHIDAIVLGALATAFFSLLWRKFDAIDRRFDLVDKRFDAVDKRFNRIEDKLDLIQRDMSDFNGITKKLEGRVDEISQRVK
jgi:hypothetical protein